MPNNGSDPFGMAKPRVEGNSHGRSSGHAAATGRQQSYTAHHSYSPQQQAEPPFQPYYPQQQQQPHLGYNPSTMSAEGFPNQDDGQAQGNSPYNIQPDYSQSQTPYFGSQQHGYGPDQGHAQSQYHQTAIPAEEPRTGRQPSQHQRKGKERQQQAQPNGTRGMNESNEHGIQYAAQHSPTESGSHMRSNINGGTHQPSGNNRNQQRQSRQSVPRSNQHDTVAAPTDDYVNVDGGAFRNPSPATPSSSRLPTLQEPPFASQDNSQDPWAPWGGYQSAMAQARVLYQNRKTLPEDLRKELSVLTALFQAHQNHAKVSATQQWGSAAATPGPSNPPPPTNPAPQVSGISQQQHQEPINYSHNNGASMAGQSPPMSRQQVDHRHDWLSENWSSLTEVEKEELKDLTDRKRNPHKYRWLNDTALATSSRHPAPSTNSGQGSRATQDRGHFNHPIHLGQEALRAQHGTDPQMRARNPESPMDMLKYQRQSGSSTNHRGLVNGKIPQQPSMHQQNGMPAYPQHTGQAIQHHSSQSRNPTGQGSHRTATAGIRQWGPSPPTSPLENRGRRTNGAGRQHHTNPSPNSPYESLPPVAGQKRHNDTSDGIIDISDDEAPIVHQAKKMRNNDNYPSCVSLQKQPERQKKRPEQQQKAAGPTSMATPAPQHSSTAQTVTVPIGNIPQATAQMLLQQVIQAYQSGAKLMPIPEGTNALLVPENSQMSCQPPGSNVVFHGKSGVRSFKEWPTIAAESYAAGFDTAIQHQDMWQSGVPLDSILCGPMDARPFPSTDDNQAPVNFDAGYGANFEAAMPIMEDGGFLNGIDEAQPVAGSGPPLASPSSQEPVHKENLAPVEGGVKSDVGHAADFQVSSSRDMPVPAMGDLAPSGCAVQDLLPRGNRAQGSPTFNDQELHDEQVRKQQPQEPQVQEFIGQNGKDEPGSNPTATDKGRAEFEQNKPLLNENAVASVAGDGSRIPVAAPLDEVATMPDDDDDNNSLFVGDVDDEFLDSAVPDEQDHQSATGPLRKATANEESEPAQTLAENPHENSKKAATSAINLAIPGKRPTSLESQTQPTTDPANLAKDATVPAEDTKKGRPETQSPVQAPPPMSQMELENQEKAQHEAEETARLIDEVAAENKLLDELDKAMDDPCGIMELFENDSGGLGDVPVSPTQFDDPPTAYDEADLPE